MSFHFEWDKQKAATNLRKHGISFDEARTVFSDPLARIFDDPDHSTVEPREIIIGHSLARQMLIVSFTVRRAAIRIISIRPVTKRERQDYEENNLF